MGLSLQHAHRHTHRARAASCSRSWSTRSRTATTAWRLGDPTAKRAGRLTLNPAKHLDPVGSMRPAAPHGARGSPHLRLRQAGALQPATTSRRTARKASSLVAFAGPALQPRPGAVRRRWCASSPATAYARPVRDLRMGGPRRGSTSFGYYYCYINLVLLFFNIIPLPPLDGRRASSRCSSTRGASRCSTSVKRLLDVHPARPAHPDPHGDAVEPARVVHAAHRLRRVCRSAWAWLVPARSRRGVMSYRGWATTRRRADSRGRSTCSSSWWRARRSTSGPCRSPPSPTSTSPRSRRMGDLDLEVASDFVLVASSLLVPQGGLAGPRATCPSRAEEVDEDLENLSPEEIRDVLVARLVAYRQFKSAAARPCGAHAEAEARMHPRTSGPDPEFQNLMPDYLEGVELERLAASICAALRGPPRDPAARERAHRAAAPAAGDPRRAGRRQGAAQRRAPHLRRAARWRTTRRFPGPGGEPAGPARAQQAQRADPVPARGLRDDNA